MSCARLSLYLPRLSCAATGASLRSATSSNAVRCLSTASGGSGSGSAQYTLPPLPYDYGALEPAISGQIMETHHKKHHQAYVNNLNAAVTQLQEAQHNKADPTRLVQLQSAINFNGGGHINHSIFWTNLAPKQQGGGSPPTGSLLELIESDFGSVSAVQSALSAASLGVQGSGWGWLGYNATTGRLQISTKANQDPLLDLVPLLGIDVWEHAYYYVYGPARAEYLKNIWSVVNWKNVQERLDKAKAARQTTHSK